MAKKYWFKPKLYGYGATPSSWEGWLVTIFFIIIVLNRAIKHENNALLLTIELIIIALIFILITKFRTEGKWKWRWGKIK